MVGVNDFLTSDVFEHCLLSLLPKDVRESKTLAVAVSGGRDSFALLHLLSKFCLKTDRQLVALTVDHDLRVDSKTEAEFVHKWCCEHQIEHHILTWEGDKPITALQEKARAKRYQLLKDYCCSHDIRYVCLGHQADDDLETVWMNWQRGSGLKGLSGMNASINHDDRLFLLRPFLRFTREQTTKYCIENELPYFDDPSNEQDIFERVRVRSLLALLQERGDVNMGNMVKSIERLFRANTAVEKIAQDFFQADVCVSELGFAKVAMTSFCALPDEVGLRVLSAVLECIGGSSNQEISLSKLEDLFEDLKQRRKDVFTLAHCLLSLSDNDIYVYRENRGLPTSIKGQKIEILWGGRFHVSMDCEENLTLAPLGEKGRKIILQSMNDDVYQKGLDPLVYQTLPAFWQDDQLIFVPIIDYVCDQTSIDFSKIDVTFIGDRTNTKTIVF